MTTTVGSPIFIDTNVLVFASIPASPPHRAALAALHRIAMDQCPAWISRQVLREYLVQITRPGILPPATAAMISACQAESLLRLYHVADETSSVTSHLLTLLQHGLAAGKQVHDANIVATCLAYGIPRLLTHNVRDFARYASHLTIVSI